VEELVKLSNVSKWFPIKKGFGKKSYLKAVDDVSFNVFRGERPSGSWESPAVAKLRSEG